MHRVLLLVVLTLSIAAAVSAQSVKGVLLGTVTDSSGAVMPGATVRIVNSASGALVYTGATASDGKFAAPALPAGGYHLTFEASGFKRT